MVLRFQLPIVLDPLHQAALPYGEHLQLHKQVFFLGIPHTFNHAQFFIVQGIPVYLGIGSMCFCIFISFRGRWGMASSILIPSRRSFWFPSVRFLFIRAFGFFFFTLFAFTFIPFLGRFPSADSAVRYADFLRNINQFHPILV